MLLDTDQYRQHEQNVLFVRRSCAGYIGGQQHEYWKHTHITVDVVAGRGSGFSVEAPEGIRFVTRSRLFTEEESAQLLVDRNLFAARS